MGLGRDAAGGSRFDTYVEGLASVIGHKDREAPLRDYCTGLLLPGERKSVEPLAAVTAPGRVAAQHQSLLHFVGEGRWSDEGVLSKVREMVLPVMQQRGAIEAWIVDDTSFPKKGRHSVGVARQYCGQLGKQDNCQVAVSLSLANADASLPGGVSLVPAAGNGRAIVCVCARRAFPPISASRPSTRSRWIKCALPAHPACRAAWC